MKFKKTEKEIIEAIVKYDGEVKSLAEVINKSHLLEKRGIAIVPGSETSFLFFKKDRYDSEAKEPIGYVAELVSLIETLKEKKYITIVPFEGEKILVVGREKSKWRGLEWIIVDDCEFIRVDRDMFDWENQNKEQIYWPFECSEQTMPIWNTLSYWYTVSQELRDLVENNFKSEEDIRFKKQQIWTWISLGVATLIGLASLIIGVIGIYRS